MKPQDNLLSEQLFTLNDEELLNFAVDAFRTLGARATTKGVGVLGDFDVQKERAEFQLRLAKGVQEAEKTFSLYAANLAEQCDPNLGANAMNAVFGAHRDAIGMLSDLCSIPRAEADRAIINGKVIAAAKTLADTGELEELTVLLDIAAQNGDDDNRLRYHNAIKFYGLEPVGQALDQGTVNPAQSHEIVKALLNNDLQLHQERQRDLAAELVEECPEYEITTLRRYARQAALKAGTKTPQEREEVVKKGRYLSIGALEDGLYPIYGLIDPEFAGLLGSAFDQATNPKLIEQDSEDDRTPGQRKHDFIFDLILIGIDADPNIIHGRKRPAVKIVTQERTITQERDESTGLAWIEGISTPVSVNRAQRAICDGGIQNVNVDNEGHILNYGREIRTFTTAQKNALIIRDGGCMWRACDRPPSWTQAHHIIEWENGGPTDINNGILLCRRHHMMLHNHGFEIRPAKTGETMPKTGKPILFWLHPPENQPSFPEPVPLTSKAPWLEFSRLK